MNDATNTLMTHEVLKKTKIQVGDSISGPEFDVSVVLVAQR